MVKPKIDYLCMTRSENKEHVSLFIILVGTLILFRNVIYFDFVWDDVFLIPKNPYLTQPQSILEIFSSGFWKFSSGTDLVIPYYRPIVTMMYILEYKVFGYFAGGYHAVNLLLHLLNIILIWKISLRFGLVSFGRIICVSIFAFHPVQVGTVCFISCHGDLLAMFFSLLTIHFWFFEKPIRWLSLLWMLFAMLSKEAAVILPVVIYFIDWLIRNKKITEYEKFIPGLVWVVYFTLRYFGLRHNEYILETSQFVWNTMGSFRTFLFIGRILFPMPVAPESGVPDLASYQKNLYHFIYLFLIVVLLVKTNTRPVVRFLIIWFFLTTLLIADWFNFNLRFSDQLLYYPLLPVSILFGLFCKKRNINFYIGLLTIVIFIFISCGQTKQWRNNLTFWSNAFQKDKENPIYALNYSVALQDYGHKKDGCDLMFYTYKIAQKKYHPVYFNLILFNLGICNYEQNPSLAEDYFKKALAVYENDYDSRKNLIILLIKEKKNAEALDQAQIQVKKNPNYKDSWLLLSDALKANGNFQESKQATEKAAGLQYKM